MKIARKPLNKDKFTKNKLYNFIRISMSGHCDPNDISKVTEVTMHLDHMLTGEEISVTINLREYEKLKAKFDERDV